MANPALRLHWTIPLKCDWAWHTGRKFDHMQIPIVEKSTGILVCVVQPRRDAPYSLATARAIVRGNNDAVNAARKKNDAKKAE